MTEDPVQHRKPFWLELEGGGTARLVSAQGDRATLEASRPFPPGSPLVGTSQDGSGVYRIKVRGSRRGDAEGAGTFIVEGRFLNLTRAQREHLRGKAHP